MSVITSYISFDAAVSGFQAGYTFDDSVNLKWDLGGKFPLVELEFSPFYPVDGYYGGGAQAFFSLDQSMISQIAELTMGIRINFAELIAYTGTKLFYIGDGTETYPYLSLDYLPENQSICLKAYDGKTTEKLEAELTETNLSEWVHLAFVFDNEGSRCNIRLFVNGTDMAGRTSDISIANIGSGRVNYVSDFIIDELYISNIALTKEDIQMLSVMTLTDFFGYKGEQIHDTVPDFKPVETEDPSVEPQNPQDVPQDPADVTPDDPQEPEIPFEEEPEEGDMPWTPPQNLQRIRYSWLAYTFDNTFDMSRDLNKTTSAIINEFNVTRILTDESGGKFRYGLTRRTDVYPNQYLKLNPGLLYEADAFTFCVWVYREADKNDQFYSYSQMKLLDFSGKGKFEFSPFKTTEIGEDVLLQLFPPIEETSLLPAVTPEATVPAVEQSGEPETVENIDLKVTDDCVLQYGLDKDFPSSFALSKSKLKTVSGKWVHYAVSYSAKGEVKIYVNGELTDTVQTGVPFSSLMLTDFKILSGSASLDPSKYFIDEIYLASRVLESSDIRKIKEYGVSRYTTEVLPDPSPESGKVTETVSVEVDLRPDETDTLEDMYTESAVIDDFVGTTFDDTSLIGKDYNNAVTAVIRNASLSQGIKNYGLTLDGISSYIRYPKGILDKATEFTISIAYKWAGHTSSTTQKLFDFSKKENSVANPSAYMRLDMGNGAEGLEFEMNDGSSVTILKADVNKKDEWVRLTVTVGNGSAKLYINGALVDSAATSIIPVSICPNYCYIGKSGNKGDALFKGTVDEIYISDSALTGQEIQSFEQYGIEPYIPAEVKVEEEASIDELWDSIINGVVIATGVLIGIIVIVIIVTILKK